MFQNIVKIALRNILKHKLYSALNILGLTVGFTAYILISLFLNYEYSWDKGNLNYDRIYRVQVKLKLSGKEENWTQTPNAINDLLKEKFPEFEQVVLLREAWGEYLSSNAVQPFFEGDGFYSDPQLFDIFTYHFTEGSPNLALTDPFSIVLSKKLADKLFPGSNALGKSVLVEKKFNLKVTGVYTDLPKNSHIRPSYIISMPTIKTIKNWPEYRSNWGYSSRNYVLLKKGVNPRDVDVKIANLINNSHKDPVVSQLYLRPMKFLYLMATDRADYLVAIYSYGLVALFILILSCINYINLTTANASMRAKEIAVRKVNGGLKKTLIGQFLGETVVMSVIAVNFALVLANLLLPIFDRIVDKEIDYSYLNNWHFLGYILIVGFIIGIISGIYPAFVLSSFKPVNLLKGSLFKSNKGAAPKKILVTFQYAISIFLIIQSIIVYKQLTYMMNLNLGFNKENLLVASIRSSKKDVSFETLRNRLLKHPEIQDAAYSQNIPFHGSNGWAMNWEGNPSDERIDIRYNEVTVDFANTLGMNIVKGRNFSREFPSDKENACLINETACKRFGWINPVGKMVNGTYRVVGVVKDFHPFSMHELIPPFLIRLKPDDLCDDGVYTFRIQPGQAAQARKIITSELESYFPNDPFEVRDFAEDFRNDGNFKNWIAISNTFLFFTILIIILAIIGIYGLVSFSASRKTKEIGIRKVHGSPLLVIYYNLIKEFLVLLLIAIVISWPASYRMYQIVPGSYKADIRLWEFLAATGLVLLITIITTSYQILKVTLTNPVKALRYE